MGLKIGSMVSAYDDVVKRGCACPHQRDLVDEKHGRGEDKLWETGSGKALLK